MLSRSMRNNYELKESLVEQNALDPEIFRKKKKRAEFSSFRSDICHNKTMEEEPESTIDYNKLVSFKHPKRAYEKFMNILIYMPEIITEEEKSSEMVKKIKQDPLLQYSQPSFVDKSFSVDENIQVTNLECFNDGDLPVAKNELPLFKNSLLKSAETSLLTSEVTEFEYFNDDQIKKMVSEKMKKMDLYNSKLENSKEWAIKRKYRLTDKDVKKVVRLQKWIKSYILRKKLTKALWMNRMIEHKSNYLKLKRCLEDFDRRNKGYSGIIYYKKYVNVFKE